MQHNKSQEIRIFISSTFRDMQKERDILNAEVFPELRYFCEKEGLILVPVDLRWGINEKDQASGLVLPICFDQIDRCRPFFIGLLGERYGSMPGSVPPELLLQNPWLAESEGASVTEMEMMYGVLKGTITAIESFFYLRDPSYVDTLEEDRQKEYCESDSSTRLKLIALKDKVQKAFVENPERVKTYAHPDDLAALVNTDMRRAIRRHLNRQQHNQDRDAASFGNKNLEYYLRRNQYHQYLDDFMAGPQRLLVVTGPSASGKSALLSQWRSEFGQAHSDALIVDYRLRFNRNTLMNMLMITINQIKKAQQQPRVQASSTVEAQRMLNHALAELPENISPVLVIDGLNPEHSRYLSWISPDLSPRLKVIIGANKGQYLEQLFDRGFVPLAVEPLNENEKRQFITDVLMKRYGKSLDEKHLNKMLQAQSTGNPLFLRALLDELRLHGNFETLDQAVALYLSKSDPGELFDEILGRYEQQYGRERMKTILPALTGTRRGLTENEILEIASENGQTLPYAYWAPIYYAMLSYLVNSGGYLSLSNYHMRSAVEKRYLADPEARRAMHRQLAKTFKDTGSEKRQQEELPGQLRKARQWKELADVMSEPAFLAEHYRIAPQETIDIWQELNSHAYSSETQFAAIINDCASNPNAALAAGEILFKIGPAGTSLRIMESLAEACRQGAMHQLLRTVLRSHSKMLQEQGQYQTADRILEELHTLNRQSGLSDSVESARLKAEEHGRRGRNYLRQGRWDEAYECFVQQQRFCTEAGDSKGLGRSRYDQARVLEGKNRWDEAAEIYNEVESHCCKHGDPLGRSFAIHGQARYCQYRGQYLEALEKFREQERLLRSLSGEGEKELSFCLGDMAALLKEQGAYEQSMEILREQETLCRRIGSRTGLAKSLRRQHDLAISMHDTVQQIALKKKLGKVEHLSKESRYERQQQGMGKTGNKKQKDRSTVNHLARQLKKAGEHERAMRLLDQELELCRQNSAYSSRYSQALGGKADLLLEQGFLEQAEQLLDEQMPLLIGSGNDKGLNFNHRLRALILEQRGDFSAALQEIDEAIVIAQRICHDQALSLNMTNKIRICRKIGDYERALSLCEMVRPVNSRISSSSWPVYLLSEEIQLYRDLGWLEKAGLASEERDKLQNQFKARPGSGIDPEGIGSTRDSLAQRKDLETTLILTKDLTEYYRQEGNDEQYYDSLLNLAQLKVRQQAWADALQNLESCRSYFAEKLDKRAEEHCLQLIGSARLNSGQPDTALAVFRDLEEISRRFGGGKLIPFALVGQGKAMAAQGNLRAALNKLIAAEQLYPMVKANGPILSSLESFSFAELTSSERQTISDILNGCRNDSGGWMDCLQNMASLAVKINWTLANHAYAQLELVSRISEDKHNLARNIGGRALVLRNLGQSQAAYELAREGVALCRDIGPAAYGSLVECLGILTTKLRLERKWSDVLELTREQIRIFRAMESESRSPGIFTNKINYCRADEGKALNQLNHLDEAAAIFDQLIACYSEEQKDNELYYVLGLKGKLEEKRQNYQAAAQAIEMQEKLNLKNGRLNELSNCLGHRATLLSRIENWDEALELVKRQENLAEQLDDLLIASKAVNNRCNILKAQGDEPEALACSERLVEMSRRLNNIDYMRSALEKLAFHLRRAARNDEALAVYDQLLAMQMESDLPKRCSYLGQKAYVLKKSRRINDALSEYAALEQIARQGRLNRSIIDACTGQADVFRIKREYRNGLRKLLAAESQLIEGTAKQKCQFYLMKCQIQIELEEFEGALGASRKAREVCQKLNNRYYLIKVAGYEAEIYRKIGQLEQALTLYKEQEQLASQEPVHWPDLMHTVSEQGKVFKEKKDWDGAVKIFKRYLDMAGTHGSQMDTAYGRGKILEIFLEAGQWDEAAAILEEIEHSLSGQDDLRIQAHLWLIRSIWHEHHADLEQACRCQRERSVLLRQISDRHALAECLTVQAGLLKHLGQIDECMLIWQETASIYAILADKGKEIAALDCWAGILEDKQRYQECVEALIHQGSLYMDLGDAKGLSANYLHCSELYIKMGDEEASRAILKRREAIDSDF